MSAMPRRRSWTALPEPAHRRRRDIKGVLDRQRIGSPRKKAGGGHVYGLVHVGPAAGHDFLMASYACRASARASWWSTMGAG